MKTQKENLLERVINTTLHQEVGATTMAWDHRGMPVISSKWRHSCPLHFSWMFYYSIILMKYCSCSNYWPVYQETWLFGCNTSNSSLMCALFIHREVSIVSEPIVQYTRWYIHKRKDYPHNAILFCIVCCCPSWDRITHQSKSFILDCQWLLVVFGPF